MFGLGKGAGKVVGEALGGVGKILDGVLTSSEERGKIDIEFNKLQTEINKLEAGSASLFVSGWRPFIGWVCGVSLACFYIPQYVLGSFIWVKICLEKGSLVAYPLTTEGLMALVTSMLGFGAIRTYEKMKGKNRN
tara:strand:- start:58 stop:462 length:405 start_codon:yes stop_codon:yes gene_type:complete